MMLSFLEVYAFFKCFNSMFYVVMSTPFPIVALSKDGIHPFKGLKPAARQANSPRTEPSKTYSWLQPPNSSNTLPVIICEENHKENVVTWQN